MQQFIAETLQALATPQPMNITRELLDLIADIVNECLLAPHSRAALTTLLSHLETMKYQSNGKQEKKSSGLEWTSGRFPTH